MTKEILNYTDYKIINASLLQASEVYLDEYLCGEHRYLKYYLRYLKLCGFLNTVIEENIQRLIMQVDRNNTVYNRHYLRGGSDIFYSKDIADNIGSIVNGLVEGNKEYSDNTEKGDIYMNVVTRKFMTETEIVKEWVRLNDR